MGRIDPVSSAIGQIETSIASIKSNQDTAFKKVDEIRDTVNELSKVVHSDNASIKVRMDNLETDFKSLNESVVSLQKFKNRALIMVAAVGGFGGVIGSVLSHFGL